MFCSVQGEHLQSGFGRADVHVLIAGLPCNVTEKTESVLKCTPTFKDSFVGDGKSWVVQVRMGIVQWLERLTHDRKVVGSNPCRSGGRVFFSGVNFLC